MHGEGRREIGDSNGQHASRPLHWSHTSWSNIKIQWHSTPDYEVPAWCRRCSWSCPWLWPRPVGQTWSDLGPPCTEPGDSKMNYYWTESGQSDLISRPCPWKYSLSNISKMVHRVGGNQARHFLTGHLAHGYGEGLCKFCWTYFTPNLPHLYSCCQPSQA